MWETGRLQDSLEPARRAVEVLTSELGDRVEVAAARSNLAFRLCEVGDAAEALREALESHRLCEESSTNGDPLHSRTLGSALNNLTCIYLATGDAGQALHYGNLAVALRRSQAVSNRDRYLPYIARTLANAAPAAAACGKVDLADRFITEARSLHAITGKRAPIFRFEEAESAAIHAIILLTQGQVGAAVRAAEESQAHLASVTSNLGNFSIDSKAL